MLCSRQAAERSSILYAERFYQTLRARDSWPGCEAQELARAARVAGQDGVPNGLGRRLAVGRRLVYLPEEATRGLKLG